MHEGEDVDEVLVIVDGVDDALTLHDKLTNMLGVGFGNLPADAGQLGELGDRIEDAIDEALGIDG